MQIEKGKCYYVKWDQDPQKCGRSDWTVKREEIFYVQMTRPVVTVKIIASTCKETWQVFERYHGLVEIREILVLELPLYIHWPVKHPEFYTLLGTGVLNVEV